MKQKFKTDEYRNYAFDGLKILFIFIVTIHHTNLLDDFLFHGYMSVDFFFITSGYMLQRTISSKSYITTTGYVFQRLKKIYPHYLLSFFILFILSMLFNFGELDCKFFFQGFFEMLMVQDLGFTNGGLNYPCWYISVLFYSSIVIFFIYNHIKKSLYNILGTLLVISIYSYILITNNGVMEIWNTVFIFYMPLWRGISGIILGMLIFQIHKKIPFKEYKKIFQVLEIICLLVILIFMCIPRNVDVFIIIAIIVLNISVGNYDSILSRFSNNTLVSKAIHYEYAIFLNHALIITVLKKIFSLFNLLDVIELIIIIISVIIYSIFTTKLIDRVTIYFKNLFLN